ncbi:diphthine--ammonia ligase [Aquimarina sp. 2-A2]|uniref:Dph6-related ATP pyrophosphatase n=1 Tax=Aquimarina sp. 2-A2 TaxID=3382644 RepID=UPI00387F2C9E
MRKTYFNWSSGKDSSLALYYMLQQSDVEITRLITTVNKDYERVSMHGLRETLLDQQAQSLGIPLEKIYLPATVSMEAYTQIFKHKVENLKEAGFTHCVFGDIFLEDLRKYREKQLSTLNIQALFPLWKKNTKELIKSFIDLGFKAITVCVNAKFLDASFCGRVIDHEFIDDLPLEVDPCGENGEFHTFVFDGPIFNNPIEFTIGDIIKRDYKPTTKKEDNCYKDEDEVSWDTSFWFCDLLPK